MAQSRAAGKDAPCEFGSRPPGHRSPPMETLRCPRPCRARSLPGGCATSITAFSVASATLSAATDLEVRQLRAELKATLARIKALEDQQSPPARPFTSTTTTAPTGETGVGHDRCRQSQSPRFQPEQRSNDQRSQRRLGRSPIASLFSSPQAAPPPCHPF